MTLTHNPNPEEPTGRFQPWTSTCSCYVVDTVRSKPVALFWTLGIPWHDSEATVFDPWEEARREADRLNANPDELHRDVLRMNDPNQPSGVLVERLPHGDTALVEGCVLSEPHTMADCDYGIPQP